MHEQRDEARVLGILVLPHGLSRQSVLMPDVRRRERVPAAPAVAACVRIESSNTTLSPDDSNLPSLARPAGLALAAGQAGPALAPRCVSEGARRPLGDGRAMASRSADRTGGRELQ